MRILGILFSALCTALAAALALLGFVCLATPHRPLFYLIDIFTLPILTAAVIATVIFAVVRQVRASVLGVIAVVLLAFAMAPQVMPHQRPADTTATPIKLVWGNMWVQNPHPQKILPWLAQKKPDIVALVEVNGHERADLIRRLKPDYPYMTVRYDMVVASRYPMAHAIARPAGFALVTVTVTTPQGPVFLAVTHLTRPWPFTAPADQPRQFARLSDSLKPLPTSRVIVVGDFNTTPSAAQLRDFARGLDLHTVPALRGTWETSLPNLMRVTIDNVLGSADLHLSHRDVGPDDGSDHRPVYVEIYPTKG